MIERIINDRTLHDLRLRDDKIHEHICSSGKQCAYFFERMYGLTPPGWLLLWTTKGWASYPISTMSNSDIEYDIICASGTKDIFYSIGLRRKKPTSKYELYDSKEIVALPGLWMTIPIRGPIYRQKNIPSSIGEALKFIKSLHMKPDIIVDAGYDLQVYWNFDHLFVFNSSADLDEKEQMSRDFQHEIIEEAKKRGWQLSDDSDLTAKLRVPGTFNWTLYPPKPVTILEPKKNVWKLY